MATLPGIVFRAGDDELREFPGQLREQLLYHLNKHGLTEPNWGVVSSASRDNLFQDDDGRPAHFAARGSHERLLAARFSYGKGRITVVKEKQGHVINGGHPGLLAFGRNVARKVFLEGIEYSSTKYHVWHPDHDTRERGFSQAEVTRYVCTDDEYISSQSLSQTQAHSQRPNRTLSSPTGVRNPLIDGLLGVPSFPQLSVTDFIHKEGDLTAFPPHLVDEINSYCSRTTDLPSCMRDPNSKSILVREGRQAVFITSDTEQELSVGRFRELRNKPGKDYIVVKSKAGAGFNGGRAMLVGELCGLNISKGYRVRDGKQCTASRYHLWMPEKDREHIAKKCQEQAILKLLERPTKMQDDKRSTDLPRTKSTSPKNRPDSSKGPRTSFREVVGLRSHNEPGLGEQEGSAESATRRAVAAPLSYAPPIIDLDDFDYDQEANLAAWTGIKRRASSISTRTEQTMSSEDSIGPEAKRQKSATGTTSVTPLNSPYTTRITNGEVSNRIQKIYADAPMHSVEWPEDEDTRMDDALEGHAPGCPALGGSHKSCRCNRPCSHTCRNKAACAHSCCKRSAQLIQDSIAYQPASTQPSRTQQGFLNTQDEQHLPPILREPRLPLVEHPVPSPAYVLPERTSPNVKVEALQHTFVFKSSMHGTILRRKTVKVCNTVFQLFGHAKVAGIADSETAILVCQYKDGSSHIVKGDMEDFDTFLETLKAVTDPQEVVVLPDTVDKRDVKLENEKLRAENTKLKEEIAAKVEQIQQQKEQFKAAIAAICEQPS